MRLKTTLEQWNTLFEVDKAGSIQAAANSLNKSHTTLIYAIRKLESQFGVSLLRIEGRRAVLTDDGKSLLRRATPMLEQAKDIEIIGHQLSLGTESEIVITVDHLCCREWLYGPISEFLSINKGTSIQIRETSLSSTKESVTQQLADIAIVTMPVTDYLVEFFGAIMMVPVISRKNPLSQKNLVTSEDLLSETQIIVRDLGEQDDLETQNAGWLKSQRRITVDNFDHAWDAVQDGLGFCRMPLHILENKSSTQVSTIALQGGSRFQVPLHLVMPKTGQSGPATKSLYELLLRSAQKRLNLCD